MLINTTTIKAYVYPLLIALALPALIGLFNPEGVQRFLYWLITITALLIPFFILHRITYKWRYSESSLLFALIKYIRPLPMGLVYQTDLGIKQLPRGTIFLILANLLIYILVPSSIVNQLAFFPAGKAGPGHIFISVFTSAFIHGSIPHLLGNMLFLWVFGSVLETRIKTKRFLLAYFFSIVASNLTFFIISCFQVGPANIQFAIANYHGIGASGAVSGIMGVFVVRCFFAKLSLTLPFLFFPFISVSFRVNAAVLIALFFAIDIAGSVHQFQGNWEIDYWAHIGGYIGGMFLGYLMGLQREAIHEALHVKAKRYSKSEYLYPEAIKTYREILEKEGEDPEALEFFFHLHRFDSQKGGELFARWVNALASKDFDRAKRVVDEHYPRHVNHLSGKMLLSLGTEYSRNAQFAEAKLCLELASQKSGPWQKKALLGLAEVYANMSLKELARSAYQQIVEQYPGTEFSRQAIAKLADF